MQVSPLLCAAVTAKLLAVPAPEAGCWHPLCLSAVAKFCGASHPRLSLGAYVTRFATEAINDEDEEVALVTALVLYERAASRAGGAVPLAAQHRLFAAAYAVAAKLTADTGLDVTMPCLARLAGVCTAELRGLERVFIADILAFDVAVSQATFAATARLVGFRRAAKEPVPEQCA